MKGYKKRTDIKIKKLGMSKSYTPKHDKRKKSLEIIPPNDATAEFYGTSINPKRAPQWCDAVKG